jgi:site-specific DNA-methyltransferase (adenine-specific)
MKALTMTNVLLQSDALKLLPTLEAESFDALITDPPYASGGVTAAARAQAPSKKYCRDGGHADFVGDERDQRAHCDGCTCGSPNAPAC